MSGAPRPPAPRWRRWTHGRVRWSRRLLAVYVAGSVCVLGLVTIRAAQPPSVSTTVYFPDGHGTSIVVFSPQLGWGSYALQFRFPGSPPCGWPAACLYAEVYVCYNPSCTPRGPWLTMIEADELGTPQTNASEFLIDVTMGPGPATMIVSTDYAYSPDDANYVTTGGSELQLLAAVPFAGGLIGAVVSFQAWRYESRPLSP